MKRDRAPALEASGHIEELAPGGDGVAKVAIDGEPRAVFVRGAAVGDEVKLSIDPSRRPARGRILELVRPGPERVEPACAYVDACGGCDWMHVSPAGQRAAHLAQLRRALPRAWADVALVPHDPCEPLGYRTRARLHVRASGGRAIVGMHEAGTHEPAPVGTCVVLTPALDLARASLGALLEGAHGTGDALVTLGAGDKPVLELRWSGALAPACFGRMEQAVVRRAWAGARVFCGEVSQPAVIGDPTPWVRGGDGEPLRLAPGGFAQASERGNIALAKGVARLARQTAEHGGRVVELFAGAGNFTVLLARARDQTAHLTAVEADSASCDAARANLAARGLSAKVVCGDALTYEPSPATTLLVLDPPRAGARDVAERLVRAPIRHVLYVSCDPQTLGRDLAILESRYTPRAIESFALFPQTSHVETVVLLERQPRARQKEVPSAGAAVRATRERAS